MKKFNIVVIFLSMIENFNEIPEIFNSAHKVFDLEITHRYSLFMGAAVEFYEF